MSHSNARDVSVVAVMECTTDWCCHTSRRTICPQQSALRLGTAGDIQRSASKDSSTSAMMPGAEDAMALSTGSYSDDVAVSMVTGTMKVCLQYG